VCAAPVVAAAIQARLYPWRANRGGREGASDRDQRRGLGLFTAMSVATRGHEMAVMQAARTSEVASMRASWSSTRREGSVPVGTVAANSKIQFYLKSSTESTIFPPLYLSDRLVI
jgi:hypothetical protein